MNSTIQRLISVVLAPIALGGVVLLVYIIAYLADRVQHDDEALTVDEFAQRSLATGIIKEAGLAGLLAPERNRVYRNFFEHKAFAYKKPEEESVEVKDEGAITPHKSDESDVPKELEEVEVNESEGNEAADAEAPDDDTPEETDQDEEIESKKNAEGKSVKGADDGAPSCSICLIDYEDGDKVMVGTRCEHMFHFDCCMQWIEKDNEICPYCRETMITPQDFLQSARELLGEDRVAKLHRINQTAARQLAQMGTSTPNNATTSPGTSNEAQSHMDIEMAAPSSTSVPVTSSSA